MMDSRSKFKYTEFYNHPKTSGNSVCTIFVQANSTLGKAKNSEPSKTLSTNK